MMPFRGAKFDGVLRYLGANLEVCVYRHVALMCEGDTSHPHPHPPTPTQNSNSVEVFFLIKAKMVQVSLCMSPDVLAFKLHVFTNDYKF